MCAPYFVEAGNRRNRRGAAVRDHDGASRDGLFAPDDDGTRIHQRAFAAKECRAGGLHRGGRPAVVEVARHPEHARGHLREVHGPFHARGSEQTRTVSLGQCFTGAEQGLGRHAAPVRALSADQLSLDNRERQAAVLEARGDRFSGDAPVETDDVKLLRHFLP